MDRRSLTKQHHSTLSLPEYTSADYQKKKKPLSCTKIITNLLPPHNNNNNNNSNNNIHGYDIPTNIYSAENLVRTINFPTKRKTLIITFALA
jgi:hypothetical protein